MSMTENGAMIAAAEIVKAGLQGGTITLFGPKFNSSPEEGLRVDALYLTKLLEALAKTLHSGKA